jgi:hypothetical protein
MRRLHSMSQYTRRMYRPLFVFALVMAFCGFALAADLKPKTTEAFDKYVAATEERMAAELRRGGGFLYPEGPASARSPEMRDAFDRLKRGEILIVRQETRLDGKEVEIPDGLVHHWLGIVFIPGVNLAQVLSVAKDYDHRAELYKPDVIAAHMIWHQDDDYRIFMRLYQRRFTTVVFNTDYAVHWGKVDAGKVYCDSISTRVAEVKDASHPEGPEEPVGEGHGYLWRLNTYWRFEEKDGGVYVQLEALSLTRDIPFGLGWLIKPLVTKIPKQSLDRALGRTREAVLERAKAGFLNSWPWLPRRGTMRRAIAGSLPGLYRLGRRSRRLV